MIFALCSILTSSTAQHEDFPVDKQFIAGVDQKIDYQCNQSFDNYSSLLDTISSFPSPGPTPIGLAWDGFNLWNTDGQDSIYKLSISGQVIKSIPQPSFVISEGGMEWDGQYLLRADEQSAKIYKIDTALGQVVDQYNLPSYGKPDPNGYGLAWDGEFLWHCNYKNPSMIYKLESNNYQAVDSFPAPAEFILGLAYADGNLYGVRYHYSNPMGSTIYKLDIETGALIDSSHWQVPQPFGLAWDGTHFWSSSLDPYGMSRIYQVSNSITSTVENLSTLKSIVVMYQNIPNPFIGKTKINYELKRDSNVDIRIFNFMNQEVCILRQAYQEAGLYSIDWNGNNHNDIQLIPGIYLCILKTSESQSAVKMILK